MGRHAFHRGCVFALLIILVAAWSGGAQTLDDRVYGVARHLMCPVCQGQTVAESDSSLAREMRALIRQKLLAGATPDEILRYFVSQFGEGVLAEPPRRGVGLVLYVGPFLALVFGLGIAAAYIRRGAVRA
jgi:cytochrome c-type biogenesis protein CcmH